MIFDFDGGEIDVARREIRRDGEVQHVEPQVFDVVRHLVDHRSRVVTREELLDSIWGDRFVTFSALSSRIKAARAALGDDGRAQRLIRTRHAVGFRFVGDVTVRLEGGDRTVSPVRYVEHGGAEIAFQVSGRGATADSSDVRDDERGGELDIVLVPGFVSHLTMDWNEPNHARFLDGLGMLGRLIRFDKRGTGLSDRSSSLPDLDTRCGDVEAVMDAVGSTSAVVVGYSEGGPMAVRLAAKRPERCRALVLYGTYAKRIRSDDYPWAPTREERLAYAAEVQDEWAFEADLRRMCPSADDAMAHWWGERCRASANPRAVRELIETNSEVDIRGDLGQVNVPTLVLHRSDDGDARVDEGRYIAEHIDGARFVELPGADHFVAVEPDQIVDEIATFIDESVHREQG